MNDYLSLGCTPTAETPDTLNPAIREAQCIAYLRQLERKFQTCRFAIHRDPQPEVIVFCDIAEADRVEYDCPQHWDAVSRVALGLD